MEEAFEINCVADACKKFVARENRRRRSAGESDNGSLRKFEIENDSRSDTADEAYDRVTMKMFMKQIHIDCLFPEMREC